MVAPSVGRGKEPLAQPSLSNRLSASIAHYLEPGIDWLARFIVHHWLLIANAMLFLFIALPFFAPILEAFGWHLPAKLIFIVYRPTCHQLPERSYFVMGHQVAICARCSSLYVAFWTVGIVYTIWAAIRPQRVPAWQAPPLWVIGVAAIPLAIDGITQLFGLRGSTNSLRTITGALVGAATAAVVYPYLHTGFREARKVWEISLLQQTALDQPCDDFDDWESHGKP